MNPYSHIYDQRWNDGDPTSIENLDIAREGVDHVKWELDNAGIGGTSAIRLNPNQIAANTTIPASTNGFSAGPASIAAGVTVTLTAGSAWNVIGQLTFGDGAGITFGDGSILKML